MMTNSTDLGVPGQKEQRPVQRLSGRVDARHEHVRHCLRHVRVREHGHDVSTLLQRSLVLGLQDAVRQVPDVAGRERGAVGVDTLIDRQSKL